jgi:general secretion pathway protein G
MNSLPPVPAMLRRCGPLLDSVRFAVTFLKWTTTLTALGFALTLVAARHQMEGDGLVVALLSVGFLILLLFMSFGAYWLLMTEGGDKRDLSLFLRAFRSDASSDQLRAWLKAAMGSSWRLGGIRPPAEREPLWVTLISPLFTGLKYLGSRQFEMVAPDHNWMARLLASFAETRMVFIDIRDITPHVLDEIRLAWQVFGPRRTIFIVDSTKTAEAWQEDVHRQLGSEGSNLLLLFWTADSATFVPQVQALLAKIPEGSATVTPEALAFVHGKVGEEQWDMSPMDRPWVLVILQQLLIGAGTWLLYLIHPWAMNIGLGLLGLEALHLYRKAWCRARRQRLNAMEVNPAGPPSARRLWGSLALMLSILASPLLLMLIASVALLGVVNEAKNLRVESDIMAMQTQLKFYEVICGRLPTTEQGLRALVEKPTSEPVPERYRALLEEVPMDAWSHPYRYEFPARRSKKDAYDLWSAGPDGLDGTADDIGNFSPQ